jgi:hypothetical protein
LWWNDYFTKHEDLKLIFELVPHQHLQPLSLSLFKVIYIIGLATTLYLPFFAIWPKATFDHLINVMLVPRGECHITIFHQFRISAES